LTIHESGQEGAKEALWWFAERKIDAGLAWSKSNAGELKATQAEEIATDALTEILPASF